MTGAADNKDVSKMTAAGKYSRMGGARRRVIRRNTIASQRLAII
jgi:hypothetical protein